MRAVSFVKRLQWDVPGTIFRHGMTLGDVDNDGDNELVVGTAEGELYIFKGSDLWQKITGLGLITCLTVGDIFNYGRNALVVICGDGWVHIFYSPRPVNPTATSLGSVGHLPVIRESTLGDQFGVPTGPTSVDVATGMSSMMHSSGSDQMDNNVESNEPSGKMQCVHVQRIPTNTKVVLLADVDKDGAVEMILGLTDRVVRSYRWSSSAELGSRRLIGLNKWECADQIGTVTLQHTGDGTPTLLVAQPGGTFMRIKCSPEDCNFDDPDSSETNSEVAASCVDYETLGISRMRNPNISTEILGDLEPGKQEFVSALDTEVPKYLAKSVSNKQNTFSDDSQLGMNVFKASSLEFKRNYSQPEMRKASLDAVDIIRRREINAQHNEDVRFYTRHGTPSIDTIDGNFIGGNVVLGEFDMRTDKKPLLPTQKDFSPSLDNNKDNNNRSETDDKNSQDSVGAKKGKPYALATLDGTIMLVQDEVILWAMQVDHQIFALCRLDVTGDGTDEIVACAWDGQTYILDQQKNSVRFQFEEPVRAFCTGKYSVASGSSSPCLVYNTFQNKIFLYHDVILPSMMVTSLDPLDTLDDKEKRILEEWFSKDSETGKQHKLQLLTEWLLYSNDCL
ncbi:KICSTOR complex protein ITFG2-like isoform X1 [Neodiprion fabricii]|uniref:KICSTOR complex protein ITFG2-like isoform X1 n=1 Tax=Neodiprion fabricii TaxID=2872261 RepID=UPI001ED8D519|nr:KICSTOR complex protein ITFG2-like isoform X1 [Neodiprion fabricii]